MLNTNEKVIKHKVGLLNLAEELGNVSKACQVMGLSRDTFYRYKAAVEESGVEALLDSSRRKPNRKNRIDEQVEQAVVDRSGPRILDSVLSEISTVFQAACVTISKYTASGVRRSSAACRRRAL